MAKYLQNLQTYFENDDVCETDTDSSNSDGSRDIINEKLKSTVLTDPIKLNKIFYLLPVSVAETVTAGALSNTLCSELGSSSFFLGGIIAYNMETQRTLLNVDADYAEKNNFANPFTTLSMAKNITKIFKSRIGLSTAGYSLPLFRKEDLTNGKCEINVKIPYAYICIYDSKTDFHIMYRITNDDYTISGNQRVQRTQMKFKIATACKKIFYDYCLRQSSI